MISRQVFFLSAALLLGLCGPLQVAGQEQDQEESTLDRINRQVEEQNGKLEEISGRQAVIEKSISRQQAEIGKIRLKEDALLSELKSADQQRLEIQQGIVDGEKRLSELKSTSVRRIRAIYMHRSEELLETLLARNAGVSVGRNALFLRKVREFDQRLMNEIVQVVRDQAQRRIELDDLAKKKNLILAKLSSERLTLEKKVKSLDVLNRELKNQKDKLNQALTALRAQALRLETVVVSLTGGEELSGKEPVHPQDKDETPSQPREHFEGTGLFREKGSLVIPVKGRILQPYGRQKVADFEDMIFSKGVEYGTSPGSAVQAIARGQVMHVGRMPGYGTIVILDHGERYYSLYGRLGKTLAGRGQIVEKGAVIAESGEKDSKGRNFYFEIRRNGNPVNPADYFKKL